MARARRRLTAAIAVAIVKSNATVIVRYFGNSNCIKAKLKRYENGDVCKVNRCRLVHQNNFYHFFFSRKSKNEI